MEAVLLADADHAYLSMVVAVSRLFAGFHIEARMLRA